MAHVTARISLLGVLVAAALAGCAAPAQPTGRPSPPATRTLSRAASPGGVPSSPPPPAAEATPSPPARTQAGPPAPKGTGITGHTVLVNCPIDRADPPCAGVPIRASLAVLNATTQAVITTVDTDARGNFTMAITAGTYLLRPVRVGSQPARRPIATTVTVTPGKYTTITLRINNGLA